MEKKIGIIAGPCSVESLESLLETAHFLSGIRSENIEIEGFRAGCWKPRSKPNTFEGEGEKAVEKLVAIKNKFPNLKIYTEVASAKHCEICLESGLEYFWIGARTVSNPFLVQEIAETLKSKAKKVLVKNPISPDLQLWLGAIERFEKQGIETAAIHRGFTPIGETKYRNSPLWQIPIELKRQRPDLKIYCDPSHIAGKREFISEISRFAIDLEFNSLMLELHPKPQEALSDSSQQLSFKDFEELLPQLEPRKELKDASMAEPHLKELLANRILIDELDARLLNILKERLDIAEKIGRIKKKGNLGILQMQRWNKVLESRLSLAESLGLNQDFVRELLQLIHAESIRRQE